MPSERSPNNGFSPVGVRGVGKYSTPFSGTESRPGVPVLGPVVRHWGDADTVQTVRDFA